MQAFTPCSWGGPVILNSTLTVEAGDLNFTNAPITFSGAISGTGGLSLDNAVFWTATAILSGTGPNTFTGSLQSTCHLLELDKPANTPAFGGALIAGIPNGTPSEIRWLNSGQGNGPTVTVYSDCVINLNGFDQLFGAITFNGGEIETGTGQLTLFEPVTVNATGVTATIDGSVVTPSAGSAAIFDVGAGGADPDLLIVGSIAGTSPELLKTGPGILELIGDSSFTAAIEVNQGTLEVGSSGALGNPSNPVTVDAGATLQPEPGAIFANDINLTGGLTVPAGLQTVLEGAITLQTDTTFDVGGSLLIDSQITGTGSLTKAGGGTLTFGGSAANTYSGDTIVDGGTLLLSKPDGVESVPGNLIIGSSARGGPSGVAKISTASRLSAA